MQKKQTRKEPIKETNFVTILGVFSEYIAEQQGYGALCAHNLKPATTP